MTRLAVDRAGTEADVAGETTNTLIARTSAAVAAAVLGPALPAGPAGRVHGLTAPRVRSVVHALCGHAGCRYLEVGAYHGATVFAASCGHPDGEFFTVDNFQSGSRQAFLRNRDALAADCTVRLVEANCWGLDPARFSPIDVFFYDGAHREEDQARAFTYFLPAFADRLVAVVDDWNQDQVRRGTMRGIAAAGLHVRASWQFFAPAPPDREAWWFGLYVAVLTKGHL